MRKDGYTFVYSSTFSSIQFDNFATHKANIDQITKMPTTQQAISPKVI